MNKPDFYLESSEGENELNEPRRCFAIKRISSDNRNDLLLVRIDPPLIGQQFGLGDQDVDQVILATRHEGTTLFPVSEWPLYVHVARFLVPHKAADLVHNSEMESFAWGELYPTEKAARAKEM